MKLLVDGDFSTWSRGFDYDDCLALIMALNNGVVKAINCVGGNVSVNESVSNALKIAGKTPVYAGSEPLYNNYFKLLRTARSFFDLRSFELTSKSAKGFLDSISVDKAVYLGPLTNHHKGIKADELVIMAGAIRTFGNITPFAEFNAYIDPVSLSNALSSIVTLVPLNVTRKAVINHSYLKRFKGELSLLGRLNRLFLHDPLTMAYALKPDLFTVNEAKIKVHTTGLLRGFTQAGSGVKVNVVTDFNRAKFLSFFEESIGPDYLKGR